MKFDARYPRARPGDEPTPGIMKGWWPLDLCTTCRALTDWVETTWGVNKRVCSEECAEHLFRGTP